MNIILSYGYTPETTALYFKRAIQKDHTVRTIGTGVDLNHHDYNITNWANVPVLEDTDLFLWVESSGRMPNFPMGISKLKIPTACYMIDSHTHLDWHVKWARQFDFVFAAQKKYIPAFERAGCKNVYWLPLAADPEIHKPHEWRSEKYDIGFIGNLYQGSGIYQRRRELIEKLSKYFDVYVTTAYGADMSKELSKCKIGFNCAVKDDLNMRVFETMATGVPLLTDQADGLTDLFSINEHFINYNDNSIVCHVKDILKQPELLDHISKSGKDEILLKHTYNKRCDYILNTINGMQHKSES